MKEFILDFLITAFLMITCFSIGKQIGRHEYKELLIQSYNELEMCETYKSLDGALYFHEICKGICEVEFEKMGC